MPSGNSILSTDTDGTVVAYNWRSSINGQLSTQEDFSTSSLSVETHTIYFKVLDNDGAWSDEVSDTLTVNSGGGDGDDPPPPPPSDPELELLEKYAPVLFMHPNENYLPKSIYSMLDESNLMEYVPPSTRYTLDPQPVNVNSLDSPPATENYYLDLLNVEPGVRPLYTAPDPNVFNNYPYTVYGSVRPCSNCNSKALQYWIFYPWNHGLNKHEGDWEMIQIWLDSNDAPQSATYFYHEWQYATEWQSEDLTLLGNHPIAYIARGGHGSYPFLNMRRTGLPDSVSEEGTILSHENTASYLSVYPNQKDTYYLVKIDDSTIWADFPGRWGYYDPDSTIYEKMGLNGPTGPANKTQWSNPEDFLESDMPPRVIWARSGSPVNLHAYDSQGRHVGLNATGDVELEIPGVYAYEPSDNETETIIILTEDEITYVIDATDAGEFNMTLERDLETVRYLADYYNVSIISDTVSNLPVGEANPDFRMAVDYDGDGATDYYIYPDSLTVIGKKEGWLYATMFDNNFNPGETVTSRVYVENTGGSAIDDLLRITIKNPMGDKVYKKMKPIYLEPDEMESFRISWTIPADASKGLYKLKVEFDDWDIDYLPAVRSFNVD